MKGEFCAGLLFNEELDRVVLIEKNRPHFMQGYLNAIGGKVESKDSCPRAAQIREFEEETGVYIYNWVNFARLQGSEWEVHFYKTKAPNFVLDKCYSKTDEKVSIYSVKDIITEQYKTLNNVPWLVSMAIYDNSFFDIKEC